MVGVAQTGKAALQDTGHGRGVKDDGTNAGRGGSRGKPRCRVGEGMKPARTHPPCGREFTSSAMKPLRSGFSFDPSRRSPSLTPASCAATYGSAQLVASVNVKLKELERMQGRRHRPRWFSLYGAPLKIPATTEMAEMTKRLTATVRRCRLLVRG